MFLKVLRVAIKGQPLALSSETLRVLIVRHRMRRESVGTDEPAAIRKKTQTRILLQLNNWLGSLKRIDHGLFRLFRNFRFVIGEIEHDRASLLVRNRWEFAAAADEIRSSDHHNDALGRIWVPQYRLRLGCVIIATASELPCQPSLLEIFLNMEFRPR